MNTLKEQNSPIDGLLGFNKKFSHAVKQHYLANAVKMPNIDDKSLLGIALRTEMAMQRLMNKKIDSENSFSFGNFQLNRGTVTPRCGISSNILIDYIVRLLDGVLVTNVDGSSNERCLCGSWSNHWLNYSNQPWSECCSVKYCPNTDLVGAHVRKIYLSEDEVYIVPMCHMHNSKKGILTIKHEVELVLAHMEEGAERV